jgi:hypothetical protein
MLTPQNHLRFSFIYFFLGAVIIALYELDELLFNNYFGSQLNYVLPVGFGLLIYGAALMMLQYLRGNASERTESNPASMAIAEELQQKLADLTTELEQVKQAQLNALSGSPDQLIQILTSTAHKGVTDELIERFQPDTRRFARDQAIRTAFHGAQDRLRSEVATLGRRGNLNLVIGVLTTAIAAGLLSYMVLNTTVKLDSMTIILSHYLPRFMLVIFIEVFSFFFLRLYRSTLAEIHTYQTDITTLTLQEVAVLAALSSDNTEAGANLSTNLLSQKKTIEDDKEDDKENDKNSKETEFNRKIFFELGQQLIKLAPVSYKIIGR